MHAGVMQLVNDAVVDRPELCTAEPFINYIHSLNSEYRIGTKLFCCLQLNLERLVVQSTGQGPERRHELVKSCWFQTVLFLQGVGPSASILPPCLKKQMQTEYNNALTSCATSYLPFMAATMSELRPSESRQSTATRLTSGFRYCGSRSSSWASFCRNSQRQSQAFSSWSRCCPFAADMDGMVGQDRL